jgi:PAS domain S-box-containing protein
VAKPVPDDSRVTDAAIRGIYAKTGKLDPKNQLNCGACGYSTCRDKAVAVVRGMAEAEMCIPYMRYLAERRTDRIIETSPNGIVTLDENLRILSMNPAFRRLFMCSEAVLGRHISYLMDPDPFERLAAGVVARVECVSEHRNYRYVFHQIMYRLPEENQFVGIFVDVTETRANRDELGRLRAETLAQARELMEHQLKVAQQVTRFLGENTARGEELVEKLVRLVGDPNDGAKERQRSVPWATST